MNKKYICLFLSIIFLPVFIEAANAKLIQILHTNDTHSYLNSTIHTEGRGGIAKLKNLITFYKNKMNDEGIQTLVMDAGDFSEGNLYYMADSARRVFEIHNEIGYDFTTLGNHEYLMGPNDLDKILGEMDSNFFLLAANLQINYDQKNLREKIKPYKELKIDGIKIAVLGLTTDEIYYKWRFRGGKVTSPYKAAKKYEEILKQRKNDFIIALTHIGVFSDIKLARGSKFIDLIIGGHSHTNLFKPVYASNINQNPIPIVQAGMHTEYLGRLIVDLKKGHPLKIISYELIPVTSKEEDPKIKSLVEMADIDLDSNYGKDWLDQKVGFSDLKINDKRGIIKWAYFITDTMKEKAHADVAIHSPLMNGDDFPIGNITRRDLFNSIPRVFELSEKYGWNIYTTKIKGAWLRVAFMALARFDQVLTFSGITAKYQNTPYGIKFKHLRINGEEINPSKYYTVAMTEGIARGAEEISPFTARIMNHPKNVNIKIWTTLEDKVTKSGDHLKLSDISEENHLLIIPKK